MHEACLAYLLLLCVCVPVSCSVGVKTAKSGNITAHTTPAMKLCYDQSLTNPFLLCLCVLVVTAVWV
jgi:hypothetical protein